MGTRGKKSTAGLNVTVVPTLRTRLAVPPELTPAQAATWRAVVASRPVDWFDGGSAPLLVAYVRAVDTQAVLATAIDAFDQTTLATDEGSATYRRLLALQEAQAKLAIKLATAMRLSQHARRSIDAAATAAKNGPSNAKLWAADEA
jgi:hypothetical protein